MPAFIRDEGSFFMIFESLPWRGGSGGGNVRGQSSISGLVGPVNQSDLAAGRGTPAGATLPRCAILGRNFAFVLGRGRETMKSYPSGIAIAFDGGYRFRCCA